MQRKTDADNESTGYCWALECEEENIVWPIGDTL
jgi:hypothetical protein